MSAAIVTTLRNAGVVLDSYIRYHRAVGFGHFYLFFDDPEDPSIASAEGYDGVTVIRHDDELRATWRGLPQFQDELIGACIQGSREGQVRDHAQVMSRQVLNTQLAIRLAREDGHEWLLHIDADEFFYTFAGTADQHFRAMSAEGLACVNYYNHEAVPEHSDIDDYFREVTLFKRNPLARNKPGLTPRERRLIAPVSQLSAKLFLLYNNGKCAVRVTEDVEVVSVHDCRVDEQKRRHMLKSPVILHYACCGFRHFWDKYRILGRFDDKWFGTIPISDSIGTFHTDARDIVATGDEAAARQFYIDRVVMSDGDLVRTLLDCGLLLRVDEPAEMLAVTEDGAPA